MPQFKTSFGNIAYQTKGESDEIIGFMNGVMASYSSWSAFEDFFVNQGYKVVSFDFIGQLLSDKPDHIYTFDQHVKEAYELYTHSGVSKIHLIGTSYGSEVAMKFALTHPEMVSSLSLINGTAEITPQLEKSIKEWIDLTYLGGYKFFWGMADSIYHPNYIKENHDFLEQRALKIEGQEEYLNGQRILYQTFLNEVHFLEDLDNISCPTVVIVGQQDTLKPVKLSEHIHQKIKDSEFLVLPNCGHVSIFEKENELKSILLGFIKKQKGESQ